MKILVLGARGFIGRHVARALDCAGFEVVPATRPGFDLARDRDPADWREKLRGIDIVVNAAGILREEGGQSFAAVHAEGPAALFAACAEARVKCVQISALGADERAQSRFHLTKRQADEALLALDVPSIVLQPSLVYGPDGASARLFTLLASLPLIPLPGRGDQRIQPVHVEDLARAVVAVVERDYFPRARVAVVGPQPLTLRSFLERLRAALGLGKPRFVAVPASWVEACARMGIGLLDLDTWRMLQRGNVADARPLRDLLGRDPRPVSAFIDPDTRAPIRAYASLAWLLPLLRVAIAVVWIVAGVVSAGLYPVEESLALLARTGLTGVSAYAALYGAALLDVALGIGTLAMKRRRALWLFQAALILVYTAIITVALPEQWLHPYGPVVKNLPMLAALAMLYTLEER
jgi:uncharacterized protein YbjT (DUF2867 family)